ncbi:uncharacterized protein N7473_010782 [Penicillium subrubescens]|uniref:Uncharacterized protein n=1 Tax=Penicillium subrubescens TaxID=1316194 RepID=A0A1Q5T2R6_9EURO|nr:uncharacterized protein N7473_010782 [Penicillium subrubescens]KAJ5883896.1 hypothetical protein N7473_010782 [Penicillium subrubescens]OKO94492.1 hypothetical protein PENSUB_11759 [Penicillium subrubescens]
MYGRPQPDPPSQPEWRVPPRREVGQQAEGPVPPPPPRPQTTGAYSPATYGPISNSPANAGTSPVTGADPRTWGVRYNQQHHPIYAPPPLPPRPSSTNEQPYAYAQPHTHPPPINNSISPPPLAHGVEPFSGVQPPLASSIVPPPYTEHPAPAPAPAISPVPPPPPKKPQGYQPTPPPVQLLPERPPLLAQGSGPAATQGSYGFTGHTSINTNVAPTGPSALGPGTPSDWEHLGPTPGEFDDAPWFPPRPPPPPQPQTVTYTLLQSPDSISTPPGYSTGMPPPAAPVPANAPLPPRVDTAPPPPGDLYHGDHSRRNDSMSPISPASTKGGRPTDPLNRMDSVSSGVSSFGGRADSIDNVIDAWVKPLSPPSRPAQPDLPPPSHRTTPVAAAPPTQSSPPPAQDPRMLSSPVQVPAPIAEARPSTVAPREPDPYEDLDPWSKSSLTRFIAMLRKEAVADSDEERYKIFIAFTAKETKLREILYNIEHDVQDTLPVSRSSEVAQNRSSPISDNGKPAIESGLIPVETEEIRSPTTTITDDGNDGDDTASEYSAGGRPTLGKRARQASQWTPKLSTLPAGEDPTSRPIKPPSRQFSLDDALQKQTIEPLTTNPPRPIYTPFQYTEGPQRGSDNLTFDRPAYQAYSELRQASAVSGRIMSNVPPPILRSRSDTLPTSPAQDEHNETFLGLIRDKSSAYQATDRRATITAPLLPAPLRQGRRSDDPVEDIRAMVWTPLDKQSESSWHITTREELDNFPDNFAYIQETVDNWESSAHERRSKLEQERTARQEESEAQIDDLFNGKEIGYADINTLEEDFRQSEARIQLDEEREEVNEFMEKVFNPLDERLKTEISALRKSYDSALNQLDRDQKGKSSPVEQCSPSVTMKLVNDIHSKLEIRFQKRLEIALDCERRRKKAERRPLVFMGDMASLRKLDGDFDRMEKRNILEAAKDRDDRANRLMDSFDDAILHGLGMNQSLLDELASKAARLDPATLRASNLPDSEVEQILKSVATFATSLHKDSEAILRSSAVAEVALNDADYNVSVAEARYANSEPDIFHRLEMEKKKEDAILQADLDTKLQSIQKGPREIEATAKRLLEELKKTPKPATPNPAPAPAPAPTRVPTKSPSPPAAPEPEGAIMASRPADLLPLDLRPATIAPIQSPSPPLASRPVVDPEVEHKERLRRALEDAKKRNAARADQ